MITKIGSAGRIRLPCPQPGEASKSNWGEVET